VFVLDRVPPPAAEATFIECDLRVPAAIDEAVRSLPDGIGAVAHVAGLPGTRPAEDVLAVNFLGLRHLLQALVAKVVDQGALAIVASTAGAGWNARQRELEPLLATRSFADGLAWLAEDSTEYPIYFTTKEAVTLFAKRWSSALWAQRRIRVNTVSPGPVETPLLPDFEQSHGKHLLDGVRDLVGRHGTPTDVAPVIVALLEPAFGWVTGQDIQVDAGFTTGFAIGALSLSST
jgi:NAD(P)-dependent dehydrogenase (short-subunit alcohol dehydrogenase family)